MSRRVSPEEAAAVWFSRRLGTAIAADRVERVDLSKGLCSVLLPSSDALCLREPDHAGRHESFPRWQEGYWSRKYWTDKWDVEEAVRVAGFRYWTVLRPAFMMENFAQPKAAFMFPHLAAGEIATALLSSTRMQLISADDVGAFARAAFDDPSKHHGKNIELAAEALTMPEVASILSQVTGRPVVNKALTPEQALGRGLFPGWVRSQEWSNQVSYCASIPDLMAYGIPLTSFEKWAQEHRGQIHVL